MEMHFLNDNYTTVNILPVCNCGYIFRDGIEVYQFIKEEDNTKIKYSLYSIQPPMCPRCGRRIECIREDQNLLKTWRME